ncbi:hypothetical protein F5I97DRAFT_1305040 [Phlebopus sp. FC_14]|nr:hypothetical protein F5I97DRAFT_1305040 [Phlebopus sp. FC_14]
MTNTYAPLESYELKSPQSGLTSASFEQVVYADASETFKGDDLYTPGTRSSQFLSPLRPQLFKRSQKMQHPRRRISWVSVKPVLKALTLPLIALGYLAFCYSVHERIIPVNTYGIYSVIPARLAAIKGAITSVSIFLVTIALWPIGDTVSDLKTEEFFRVLSGRTDGVPLSVVNGISNPSFGYIDSIRAVFHRHCSSYFTSGLVASALIFATSILAPAALTIQSVLSDGDIVAFAVGSIPSESVWNLTDLSSPGVNATSHSDVAASIMWAEAELGVQYSFGIANSSDPKYAAFIVPVPPDLSTTTSARWLTDVIGLNPSCAWSQTNITEPMISSSNDTFDATIGGVYLTDFDLDVGVDSQSFSPESLTYAGAMDPSNYVFNHTTQTYPTDGSTVFLLGQCTGGCQAYTNINSYTWLNMTDVPSFTVITANQTWEMGFLVCKPNPEIETREIRSQGNTVLQVQPLPTGKKYVSQGNLHPTQTPAMLAVAMMGITSNSGPQSTGSSWTYSLGSQVQMDLLFGKEQIANLPSGAGSFVNISVLPLANVSQTYTHMLQSAAKAYTAGYFGTAYVPGRISTVEVVFTASMPHVALSTVLFIILSIFTAIAHYRKGKGSEFTLVNVAAAVHGSELPAQFAQMKSTLSSQGSRRLNDDKGAQEEIAEMFDDRQIFLQKHADGSAVLRVS